VVLERERWTVDDFAKKLGLRDYGIDTAKDLGAAMGIDNEAVVSQHRIEYFPTMSQILL
jgi:hypothetical protein